jgi:hypothetical protein
VIPTTAPELVQHLRDRGFQFQLNGDGSLEVAPAERITPEIDAAIEAVGAQAIRAVIEAEAPMSPRPVDPAQFALVTPPESFITKYVGYAQMCTDAPAAAHQLMAVGLLSTAAGPRVRFPLAFRPDGLPLTIWTLYVVDSAMGRKSTFEDIGVNLLRDLLSPEQFFTGRAPRRGSSSGSPPWMGTPRCSLATSSPGSSPRSRPADISPGCRSC